MTKTETMVLTSLIILDITLLFTNLAHDAYINKPCSYLHSVRHSSIYPDIVSCVFANGTIVDILNNTIVNVYKNDEEWGISLRDYKMLANNIETEFIEVSE